jgi:hypothetical protein
VYIVAIDKDGMNLLHTISIENVNIHVDIPSKVYTEKRGKEKLFNKYIKAIKAEKVTLVNRFIDEEFSNIKKDLHLATPTKLIIPTPITEVLSFFLRLFLIFKKFFYFS